VIDLTQLHEDLEPGLDPAEQQALLAVAERLDHDRPLPSPRFRGRLRRSLLRGLDQPHFARPPRFRLLVGAYSASATALFALPLAGVLGAGPFAA
jgi:hypothetical protein